MKAISLAVLALTLLLSCGSRSSGAEKLVLTGSSTVAPLAAEIAKRYESTHSGVQVDVQTGGSSRGVADARNGLADIGMASRELKAEEQDLFATTIARDGICMIVHEANPVPALTREQVIAIYTDRINNWKELGGPDLPITVVHKADGRSTLELFLAYFGMEHQAVKPDVVIGDNAQGLKTVMGNRGALGYVSIGAAEYEATHGGKVRLLPMDGVEASVANVANLKYPLSRPLNLITKAPPTGRVADFIAYARSAGVMDIVEGQYFVPESH